MRVVGVITDTNSVGLIKKSQSHVKHMTLVQAAALFRGVYTIDSHI